MATVATATQPCNSVLCAEHRARGGTPLVPSRQPLLDWEASLLPVTRDPNSYAPLFTPSPSPPHTPHLPLANQLESFSALFTGTLIIVRAAVRERAKVRHPLDQIERCPDNETEQIKDRAACVQDSRIDRESKEESKEIAQFPSLLSRCDR